MTNQTPPAPASAEPTAVSALEACAQSLIRARERTILLVEDTAAHAALIRRALDPKIWNVEHVTRASEAMVSFTRDPHRIVLLDLSLPDSEGLALLTQLRSVNPAAAVVIVTSLEHVSTSVEAMQRGAWDYLVKGDPKETHDHVQRAVERAWQKRLYEAQTQLIEQTKVVELVRTERLEAIELVVRTVCHEINNPLSGVMALSQLLEGRADLPDDAKRLAVRIRESAAEVAHAVKKLQSITDSVTEFGGKRLLETPKDL